MGWVGIGIASWDTLIMVTMSLLFSVVINAHWRAAVPVWQTSAAGTSPYAVLSAFVVNVLRSVPFIILLIVMIPGHRDDDRHVSVGNGREPIPPRWLPAARFAAWSKPLCGK